MAKKSSGKKPASDTVKKTASWHWEAEQGRDRNQWLAPLQGTEANPPRIKQLDERTFACYRDGTYLGCEATLALAQARCVANVVSGRNRALAEWEQNNPGELPPFLELTPGERAEWWRRNPPKPIDMTSGKFGRPATPAAEVITRGVVVQRPKGKKAAAAPQGTIRVLNATNPKRAGTPAHARWAALYAHDGKTVAAYAAARGNLTTLRNAVAKKHVEVR